MERILITVKTYPVLSRKYAELVCTAGVTEAGEWRRVLCCVVLWQPAT